MREPGTRHAVAHLPGLRADRLGDDRSPTTEPPVVRTGPAPAQPRRGLALVGLGMGLAIVGVAVAGVKLLGGPKTHPRRCRRRQRLRPRRPAGDRGHRAGASAVGPRGAGARRRHAPAPRPPATPRPAKRPSAAATASATAAEGQGRARHHRSRRRPAAGGRAGRGPSRHGPPRRQGAPAPRGAGAEGRDEGPGREAQRDRTTPTPERADPRPPLRARQRAAVRGRRQGRDRRLPRGGQAAPSDPIGFRGLGLAYEQQGETVSPPARCAAT